VVYDARARSVLNHPELRETSIAVFSFGKTLHATGLRVGYGIARRSSRASCARCISSNTFSIAHPCSGPSRTIWWRSRIRGAVCRTSSGQAGSLRAALADTPFTLPPAEGTYFQLIEYSAIANGGGCHFAERLLVEAGVATIRCRRSTGPRRRFRAAPVYRKRDRTLDDAPRLQAFANAPNDEADE